MARQKDTFYFDGFRRSADYACQAAKLLSEVMHDFNPGQLRERMDSMHAIEKSADEVRHDMMDELVTAFITPFDREDIDELGHVLDDVTDSIEGVLNRMYYDNVTDMRDDAVQMSDMVVRATESICKLVNELPRFRHSKTLRELVFAINQRRGRRACRRYAGQYRHVPRRHAGRAGHDAVSGLYAHHPPCPDAEAAARDGGIRSARRAGVV